jgi:hypothetical protein
MRAGQKLPEFDRTCQVPAHWKFEVQHYDHGAPGRPRRSQLKELACPEGAADERGHAHGRGARGHDADAYDHGAHGHGAPGRDADATAAFLDGRQLYWGKCCRRHSSWDNNTDNTTDHGCRNCCELMGVVGACPDLEVHGVV